jgi:hypothetical protein
MLRILVIILSSAILAGACAYGVHAWDVRNSDRAQVTSFNDGYATALCDVAPSAARADGIVCREH